MVVSLFWSCLFDVIFRSFICCLVSALFLQQTLELVSIEIGICILCTECAFTTTYSPVSAHFVGFSDNTFQRHLPRKAYVKLHSCPSLSLSLITYFHYIIKFLKNFMLCASFPPIWPTPLQIAKMFKRY